jgi:Domain of unknown function (DU1801)
MAKKPTTVKAYLASLPADRRAALEAVRAVILENLDEDYEEGIQYGMIGYYVPHRVYPAGYHCDKAQPVPFVSLASQKNYMSLYLMCVYSEPGGEERFRDAWTKAMAKRGAQGKGKAKKINMGKSCVRFTKIEDVPLEVIGKAIKRVPTKKFLANYEKALAKPRE